MPTTRKPFTPAQEKMIGLFSRPMSWLNTWIYRVSGGTVGGRWKYGAPVMLLTVVGRKSGTPRTTPLLYLRDGEAIVTVASKAGVSRHPQWFLNLERHPDCEVQIGRETTRRRARRATDEEKTRLWPRLITMYPDYDVYQQRTERDIPVVILSPV
jgi:deazaflavin-dependent oxidoreductase (nitroreductase family)